MVKLSIFLLTFEINVILLFSLVSDVLHHFVVRFWWNSLTTFYFTIKISLIVDLILYQVLQGTLWLEVASSHLWLAFGGKFEPRFISPLQKFS